MNTLVTVNVHGVGPEAGDGAGRRSCSAASASAATPPHRPGPGGWTPLRRSEIKATFFWPVFEAERCRACWNSAWPTATEVASNGLAFEDHIGLGDHEDAVLEEAHSRLTALCDTAPVGFRAPTGTLSNRTLPILQRPGLPATTAASSTTTRPIRWTTTAGPEWSSCRSARA